ncbi:MAG: hypothetical protein FGM24_09275 [Candidatus Kapabacteria bacterium]|nr:hypothetical protein [Candidatus Kapabacteria bacterium]
MSPLDADGPRSETPLTPAEKVTPTSYTAEFTTSAGPFTIKGLPVLQIDTTVTPAVVWLDVRMERQVAPDTDPILRSFRLRADSVPGNAYELKLDGAAAMEMALKRPNDTLYVGADALNNTASIVVAEQPRVEGQRRTILVMVYLRVNNRGTDASIGREYVYGKLTLEI